MRRALSAGLAIAAVAASGCGPGGDGQGAQLLVTEDFGTRAIADLPQPKVGANETPLGIVRGNVPGVRTTGPDWSLYVNGVGIPADEQGDGLRDADVVWWDRHDRGPVPRVRAVVGSFPEPFRHGLDGKRLPLRIECTPADIPACQTVQDAMTAAGVFAAQGGLQQSITKETLRIIVGPWERIRDDDAAGQLARGPRVSGVYARPARDGRSIAILDQEGRTTRTLGPGSGLIAATRLRGDRPVWIVTAPDAAGVAAAAKALDQGNLKNHFALAVDEGRAVAVPEVGVAARP